MYLWQASQWPQFNYQLKILSPLLFDLITLQKQLIGKTANIPHDIDQLAQMDALIQNALKTSEIEGESLNLGSVRSSVAKHLGLNQAGLVLNKSQAASKQTESLVAMLCQATANIQVPLNLAMLCKWQAALFAEPPLLRKISIGKLRGEAPMQVVSERNNRQIIHFEAPPKKNLLAELEAFLSWFNHINDSKPEPESESKSNLNSDPQSDRLHQQALLRAGIAHLWFITLHPFEDGNGRVARALTDRALAQADKTSVRFYSLSAAIEMHRKEYYDILETTQNCTSTHQTVNVPNNFVNDALAKLDITKLDITDWLVWFLKVLAEAMQQGIYRIDRVVDKARFWQRHSQTILTERQVKVLNRLLDSAGNEFSQGINASQYKGLTKVSKATATRDLTELLAKDCLERLPGSGRNTRYQISTII